METQEKIREKHLQERKKSRMEKLKTRKGIRTLSFCLAAVLVIAGAGISGYGLASRYRDTIEYSYHRALNQLTDYVSTIESTLTKGTYANTATQQYGLASKLMVNAESAKNALSQLPLAESESEALQKYLAQVGDFSTYAIGILSRGEEMPEECMENVDVLLDYAKKISPLMEELSAHYGQGNDYISDTDLLSNEVSQESKETEDINFSNTFIDVNENFVDYPSLIYDGPFADQVQQKTPRMTKDAEGFSVEAAQARAAEFLNMAAADLTYKESRKGNMPVYVFTADNLFVTVTIKGGYICEFYNTAEQEGTHNYNFEDLTKKAKDFLKQRKIDNMSESYYVNVNGVCTVNYAYREETKNAVCYSDLIKVGVSIKNGKVVTYNATGYIMNHMNREIEEPKLSVQEAKASVSEKLTIESADLALIPNGGSKEVLCYEFTCMGQKKEQVMVYINCSTGLEEEIFILLQSDGGTLVI